MIAEYRWPAVDEFRNRDADLAALESWWRTDTREPVSLSGRRRVGKSWLFRRFAHGKPAVILVAEEDSVLRRTLGRFASALEPVLGVRPQISDVGELFRVLYAIPARAPFLVVIDEFPSLLGGNAARRRESLSAIQAAMEEGREGSRMRLLLAGSVVSEMAALQETGSPLHGRLRPLDVRPLSFFEARTLIDSQDSVEQLTRYGIAGGMPRYLADLGSGRLADALATHVLDRRSGLFNEPLTLLQAEVRAPATFFAILEALAAGPRKVADIGASIGVTSGDLTSYLDTLAAMQLIAKHAPAGASPASRNHQWACTDNFIRFWFRFVWPNQSELEAGADAAAYVRTVVGPALADHVAPVFEAEVASWLRRSYSGRVTSVGAWWGNALHPLRREKVRQTEQIDAVGLDRRRVVVAAEAKWTNAKLDAKVVTDLIDFKLPAMAQAGFDVSETELVLASRSGFTKSVHALATDSTLPLHLITADDVLSGDVIQRARSRVAGTGVGLSPEQIIRARDADRR